MSKRIPTIILGLFIILFSCGCTAVEPDEAIYSTEIIEQIEMEENVLKETSSEAPPIESLHNAALTPTLFADIVEPVPKNTTMFSEKFQHEENEVPVPTTVNPTEVQTLPEILPDAPNPDQLPMG